MNNSSLLKRIYAHGIRSAQILPRVHNDRICAKTCGAVDIWPQSFHSFSQMDVDKNMLILASGSRARADMLTKAGVRFDQKPAKIDEDAIKSALLAEGAKPEDIADALAEYKAKRVAQSQAGFVLGSDQILVCENEIINKVDTIDEARAKLRKLRGKPHTLLSAAVIYEDHKPVWRKIGRAQLFMRQFTDAFLDEYLEEYRKDILSSVGCYLIEDGGVKLFDRIQGDYHSILGMPLLDVLNYLRTRGVLAT